MKNIRKLFSAIYTSLNGNKNNFVKHTILKKDFKLIKGTYRGQPDKDDAWIQKLAQHSKIFLDIGSNKGYTSILANSTGNINELILVDPNPFALSNAATNLIFNNMSCNCRFYCAFVSDRDDELIEFYSIGTGEAGSMYKSHATSASLIHKHTLVPTVTIDYICNYYKVIPDLIKIDVEGAENLVLKGAKKIFKNQSSTFIVEMHSNAEVSMTENANMVLKLCKENSYNVWYMKEHLLIEKAEHIAKKGRCHFLLIPKDKKYPEELKSIKQHSPIE